jgi:Ca2+/Na+ antiporter
MITLSAIIFTIGLILAWSVIPRILASQATIIDYRGLRRCRIMVKTLRVIILILCGYHLLSVIRPIDGVPNWTHGLWMILLVMLLLYLNFPETLHQLETKLRAREESPTIENCP